jgi:hypothetical protein
MDGTGDQRVLRRRGIAADGQPGGQAQRPRYGRGRGVGRKRTTSARLHPKPSNSRRHLDHLTMRGGGRVRRAGARLPGSAQSARGDLGRGQGGNGPGLTRGWNPTELGGWPTRGLPEAWQRGPATRSTLLQGRGLAHLGGPCPPHGKRADNGCCCSVGAGWRSRTPLPEHCRLQRSVQGPRVAPTGTADLGRRWSIG